MSSRFTIGLVCHRGIGPERGGRSVNEDNYLVCSQGTARHRADDRDVSRQVQGSGMLVAVADGMGGHEHGALASQAAVESLVDLYAESADGPPEVLLREHILSAHARLRRRFHDQGHANSGTTLTAAWVRDRGFSWAHVGDSRLYLLRGSRLRRYTTDHNRAEFARRMGRRPPREGHFLVQNFIFGSRGLGADETIRVDPGVDTGTVQLNVGDRLLLCSDGLCGFVSEPTLREVLYDVPEPTAAAARLSDMAVAYGSDDNITVLVIRVDEI